MFKSTHPLDLMINEYLTQQYNFDYAICLFYSKGYKTVYVPGLNYSL